jgi:hypothetical protein
MGIIHGNSFEHGLRVCDFVASHNLGLTNVRFCDIGRPRVSDHVYFYSDLDPAFLRVAAHVQPDCFEEINIGTRDVVRGE